MMRFLTSELFRQAKSFAAVGVLNTIVGLAVIVFAHRVLGWGPTLSNAAGYGVGALMGYMLNRTLTFRSAAPVGRSMPRYAAVLGVGYASNLGVLHTLLWLQPSFVLAQALAMVAFSTIVFFGSRSFAFDKTG
jgi:putative flippase GtrA